ncbi:MAG TPA: His-Xaa-Ser system radical SAM maturase HxsC [Caulobacteraceae bacterium]|nr:His-Xaa-Ser system radical SAM maturase HxsC [Caulobacteraceae bacterium]
MNAREGAPNHQVLRLVTPADPRVRGPQDAVLVKGGGSVPTGPPSGLVVQVGGEATLAEPGTICLGDEFDYLAAGDVIAVHADSRRVRTLYRRASRHNSFLTTERCNHYCLMCSQPPKNIDDRWLLDEIAAALPLVDPATRSFGLTGGEPLLQWERLVALLAQARDVLPNTAVHVLTNGRAFASPEIADAWAAIAHPDLSAGIPIYAAVDSIHDYVVQAEGAFDETVLGVLRLKERRQRVEIRVVLHSITAPRIVETATWLARNLPFVDHVALMGLENTGFAIANDALLWIDPIEYRASLARAVDILDAARVPTSIYNLPYCVLERPVWPFAAQSISDWKNAYLPQCDQCAAKRSCAGFFSTGRPKQSRAIEPLRTFDLTQA